MSNLNNMNNIDSILYESLLENNINSDNDMFINMVCNDNILLSHPNYICFNGDNYLTMDINKRINYLLYTINTYTFPNSDINFISSIISKIETVAKLNTNLSFANFTIIVYVIETIQKKLVNRFVMDNTNNLINSILEYSEDIQFLSDAIDIAENMDNLDRMNIDDIIDMIDNLS